MKATSAFILFSLMIVSWPAQAGDKWDIEKFDLSKLPPPAEKADVTFAADILPLCEASCVRCHGEDRDKGDLRLDSLEATLKGGKEGKVVIPGDSKKSLLVVAAAQIDDATAMPPKHGPGGNRPPGAPPGGPGGFGPPSKALTAEQVGLIRAWIDEGAK
jgi:hypothetical protein